jgi:hypothetical protein
VVGPATPPVIRAITVPTSRVEAGANITLTATVEDAETPLTQLAYQWAASAGTISGSGTTATWTMPAGIKTGVNVTISLTVVDTYDAVVNNQVVKQQFTVIGTSSVFRVHDSVAETKELARRFLIDLFGNSAVPVEACLADFTELGRCAEGKRKERDDIVEHRKNYVVVSAQIDSQTARFFGSNDGEVRSISRFRDRVIATGFVGDFCGDFVLTTVYAEGRWWLCESTLDRSYQPSCPNTSGMSRIWGRRSGGEK